MGINEILVGCLSSSSCWSVGKMILKMVPLRSMTHKEYFLIGDVEKKLMDGVHGLASMVASISVLEQQERSD